MVGTSATIRQAFDMARRAGTVTVVGAGRFDDVVEIGAMEAGEVARSVIVY